MATRSLNYHLKRYDALTDQESSRWHVFDQVTIEELEFSPLERKIYDSIYISAKRNFEKLNAKGLVSKNYTHILAMLMRYIVQHMFDTTLLSGGIDWDGLSYILTLSSHLMISGLCLLTVMEPLMLTTWYGALLRIVRMETRTALRKTSWPIWLTLKSLNARFV